MRRAIAALGVWAVSAAWSPQLTAACSIFVPPPFEVDASAQDSVAPSSFRDLRGSTRQVSGTRCDGKSCTSSSCGDWAGVELTFTAPSDDQTPTARLGYRVVWLRGEMPSSWRELTERVQPLSDAKSVSLPVEFSEITRLNGDLALVAVDRAGNESAPSEAVHVEWNGCMMYFDQPGACADTHACSVVDGVGASGERTSTKGAAWLQLTAAGLCAAWWLRRGR